MDDPSNRDMRSSDRASRESYRMSRPERRIARNREDVSRLIDDLESYNPKSQVNRDMARKIAALTLGTAALPVGVGANVMLQNARERAQKDPYYYASGQLAGQTSNDLSPLERMLIKLFGEQ